MKKYIVLWSSSGFYADDDELVGNCGITGVTCDRAEARRMAKEEALDYIHNEAEMRADSVDDKFDDLPEEELKKNRAKWIDEHVEVDEEDPDDICVTANDDACYTRLQVRVTVVEKK